MMIDLYEEVKHARTVAIGGHIKPDGDCIGAVLATMLYLRKRCPDKEITAYLQKPAPCFVHCPGIEHLNTEFDLSEDKKLDVFILLDTVPERLGEAKPLFDRAEKTINIDHHITNADGSCMVNCIDPAASAASELVLRTMDREFLDADIASLLYMGIAHDTGVFQYSNTSPETMRAAADLLEYGFDFSKLLDETFFEKTYRQNQILSHVLLESRLYFDGQFILGTMDGESMKKYGATKDDFDGIVSQLRNTKGVRCAAFLYEKEPGLFKTSLRSSDDLVDVASVSKKFGGGGHVRASGFDFRGSCEEAIQSLLPEIEKQLCAG